MTLKEMLLTRQEFICVFAHADDSLVLADDAEFGDRNHAGSATGPFNQDAAEGLCDHIAISLLNGAPTNVIDAFASNKCVFSKKGFDKSKDAHGDSLENSKWMRCLIKLLG